MLINCRECSAPITHEGNTEFCSRTCRTVWHNRFTKRKYPVGFDTSSSLYKIWRAMHLRCYTPSHAGFKNYGARGITVCDEWRGKGNYPAFIQWALANGYRDGLTIERGKNAEGYSPGNCAWIERAKQAANRRNSLSDATAFGETKSVIEWSRDPRCTVSYVSLIKRLASGKPDEIAISAPPRSMDSKRAPFSQAHRQHIAEAAKTRNLPHDRSTGRFLADRKT